MSQIIRFCMLCIVLFASHVVCADVICPSGQYLKNNVCVIPDDGYYPSGCRDALPSEYKRLNYLEGNGGQYIDTGLRVNFDYEIETVVNPLSTGGFFYWGDAEYHQPGHALIMVNNSGPSYWGTDELQVMYSDMNPNTKNTIIQNKDHISINGHLFEFQASEDIDTGRNLFIFKTNPVSSEYNTGSVQIYYMKIRNESGDLLRHFVPAMRKSDGVLGMFDLANNKFYTNGGDGHFSADIYGLDYTETDLIDGCTTQVPCTPGHYCVGGKRRICQNNTISPYTGATQCTVPTDAHYATDCEAQLPANFSNQSQSDSFIGCKSQSLCNAGYFCVNGFQQICAENAYSFAGAKECTFPQDGYYSDNCTMTKLEYIQSTGAQYIDTGLQVNADYEIEAVVNPMSVGGFFYWGDAAYEERGHTLIIVNNSGPSFWGSERTQVMYRDTIPNAPNRIIQNKQHIIINDKTFSFPQSEDVSTRNNFYIFKTNPVSSQYNSGRIRIHSLKIRKEDGTVVRDFVPTKRNSDGMVGMLDMVTGRFYENLGSGNFIAGPVKKQFIGCTTYKTCEAGFYCAGGDRNACSTGTWSGAQAWMCNQCANAPANAEYTDTEWTHEDCPWKCSDGFVETAAKTCSVLCGMGVHYLRTSNDHKIPLFATKNTSPSIVVSNNIATCYADLVEGAQSDELNMQYKDKVYHTVQ